MRKNLLVLAMAGLFCVDSVAVAQSKVVRAYLDKDIPGVVKGVSENGEWAVGQDGGIVTYASFIWNKRAGRYKDIFGTENDGSMGTSGANCEAHLYDVSDNGVAVGCFSDGENPLAGGSIAIRPGYFDYNASKWTALPGLDGVELVSGQSNGCATKISPDGKIIAGYLPVTNGTVVPVLWIDGKAQRVDNLEYVGQGGYVLDMTDDGSVLVGWVEWEDGSRTPAVFKDGKRIRIIGTEPANTPGGKWEYFYYGGANSISPDGKTVGGEFSLGDGVTNFGWTYNIPEVIEEEEMMVPEEDVQKVDFLVSHIGNNNHLYGATSAYGPAQLMIDGSITTFNEYYGATEETPTVIFDANLEENTFASAIAVELAGGIVNSPLVLTVEDGSGIYDAENSGIAINKVGTTLNVYGYHTSVSIYNVNGVCVYEDNSASESYDLSGLTKGIYVVKVTNDKAVETEKISL